MNSSKLLFFIFSFFGCTALFLLLSSCNGTETPIRVASFNVRLDTPNDADKSWEHRKELAANLLKEYDLDIIGTQEGFKHQLEDLLCEGKYAYVGVGRDDGIDGGEHSAILYKTKRFELEDSGNFWLSETPDVPSYGWKAKYRRICSWAKFSDRKTDHSFYVFNVHFDHETVVARRESANLLLAKAKEIAPNSPIIFTGDFNASPQSEPIQIIVKDGLVRDTKVYATSVTGKPDRTYHGYNPNETPNERIDYIFVSPHFQANSYDVLTDNEQGRYPSDHFPIVVDLVFKR